MSPLAPNARRRHVLIIVENLPVPFDRRVWAEATTLARAGYAVSVICPTGPGCEANFETLEGVDIHRHALPLEADGAFGYLREYGAAMVNWLRLAMRIHRARPVDVIHGCNPPDLIFVVALAMRAFGVRFLFDHHDLCPELFEAKFGRKGLMWRLMLFLERLTFRCATVSIATNESYAEIARRRGRMAAEDVFVVRSAPRVETMPIQPPNPALKRGARHLVGYVGVIGGQEGLDLLLDVAEELVLRRGRTDLRFAIVGDGPAAPAARADCSRRGLASHVEFTGRIDDVALLDVLNTADVCVNPDRPSPMNDLSTMNKIVEYMALGKPIVQFDLREGRASAQEASLYARPGDCVDFADKLAFLLDNPEERMRRGAYGRERFLTELAWSRSEPHLLAAYERIFAKDKGGRPEAAAAIFEADIHDDPHPAKSVAARIRWARTAW